MFAHYSIFSLVASLLTRIWSSFAHCDGGLRPLHPLIPSINRRRFAPPHNGRSKGVPGAKPPHWPSAKALLRRAVFLATFKVIESKMREINFRKNNLILLKIFKREKKIKENCSFFNISFNFMKNISKKMVLRVKGI